MTVEVDRLLARLITMSSTVSPRLEALVEKKAYDLMQYAKENATGRPGPNVVTGTYYNSFYVSKEGTGLYRAANSQPQSKRLEYGFVGTDSLGRVYHQPAFPHFRPAAQRARVELIDETKQLLLDIMRGKK